ncbi:MAG: ABC transporter permease [Ruminococcus sp.]|nr:ABC transporter permease [Ruminococcus sp.]
MYKVFLKILRSKLGIALMYIGIFLGIGMASANSSKEQVDFTESKAGIVINDMDNTEASKSLCEYLSESNNVSYGDPSDMDKLDAVYYNPSRYYLTINKGFSDSLAKGQTQSILSHSAQNGSYFENLVDSKIDLYLTTASAYIAGGSTADEAFNSAKKALSKKTEVEMISKHGSEYAETLSPYYKFIPYIFLGVFLFALCPVIIAMTQKEIKNRTFSSSLSPKRFLLETTLGTAVFMIVVYVFVCIFVPLVIFGCKPTREIFLSVINCLAFTVMCASLVLLISNLISDEKLVNLVGNIVALGMSFLCGVFVPLQYLGDSVKKIAVFLPAYWFEVLNSAIGGTDGQVYSDSLFIKCIGIQLAFAAALVLATFAVLKAKENKTGVKHKASAASA